MKLSPIILVLSLGLSVAALVHPGLLHSTADFERIKKYVGNKTEPWYTGWQKLAAHADPDHEPRAVQVLCRGTGSDVTCTENYSRVFVDAAAAYANAIYWQVTGDTAYADAAARILDAWSGNLTLVTGSSDKFLASGLYGYQLANVGEIMRAYTGWHGLDALIAMLYNAFYPLSHSFIVNHNGAAIDHYWANWDLCNLAGIYAIGVLSDNDTMMNEAIDYFQTGEGNGALTKFIWHVFYEDDTTGKPLGQGQEAGRDQGHATLDFAMAGVLAQQAWNQGLDLFSLNNNLLLAGSEYSSKYNVGSGVPFTTYTNSDVTQTSISNSSRGSIRPMNELLYAHYASIKGLNASWTGAYRDMVVQNGTGAEGGGGDYGPNSGGYDQLGFGTLLYRLEA